MRILLVDDDEDTTVSLQTLLEFEGHKVKSAFNACDALRLAPSFAPEGIVLDLGLPDTSGFALCRELRRQNPTIRRAVALTGYGEQKTIDACRRAGFDAHLLKPCSVEEVMGALASPALTEPALRQRR
jgi:CheY-like chemotaxis protein